MTVEGETRITDSHFSGQSALSPAYTIILSLCRWMSFGGWKGGN